MATISSWRASERERADALVKQGLAMKCTAFPCPDVWLEQRDLFQRAIEADRSNARAYAEAAFTYTQFVTSRLTVDRKEDLRIAADLVARAVALAPNQAFAHVARAGVLRLNPETLEKALAAYQRALVLQPNHLYAQANSGWVLILLGRPAEAEPYVQAALAVAPNHSDLAVWMNRLGLIDFFLDRDGHGANYFRQAIARQSTIAAMGEVGIERAINLAAALALNGELNEARQVVEALRQQYPRLSTNNIWSCVCSTAPNFRSNMEKLRRAAILAGVIDAG
jgi:Tfp pilus assembly protein PilF